MNARKVVIGLLLGALAGGCRASNVGLGAGDGGQAVTPERPARPPVIPNLDASPASDAAAANPAPPPADGSTPAPDGAPTAPPDAATVDATTTPPAADAARSDVASPVDAPTAPVVPDGCGIVTCDGVATRRDCCRAWYFFALESEDRNYVQRDALVTSFTKGADVRATYAFDRAGQDGAVGMLLDRPRRPTTIRVTSQFRRRGRAATLRHRGGRERQRWLRLRARGRRPGRSRSAPALLGKPDGHSGPDQHPHPGARARAGEHPGDGDGGAVAAGSRSAPVQVVAPPCRGPILCAPSPGSSGGRWRT